MSNDHQRCKQISSRKDIEPSCSRNRVLSEQKRRDDQAVTCLESLLDQDEARKADPDELRDW